MGEEVFITAIIFITIYLVIELFVRRKERLMIIEKAASNQSLDIAAMLKQSNGQSFSALKIGCLLAGLGIGFLIGFIINRFAVYPEVLTINENSVAYYSLRDMGNMLYTASVLAFGGIGLVIAYLVEKPKKN